MAPSHSRQLLIWGVSIPTVVLLSYLWYRRKRLQSKTSDPGDTSTITPKKLPSIQTPSKAVSSSTTPVANRTPFSRSLSGVDSAPIDIVIPPKLKAAKSNPVVISDEDLDLEIEKIKSMRYGGSIDTRKSNCCEMAAVNNNNKSPAFEKKASPLMVFEPKVSPVMFCEKKASPVVDQIVIEEEVAEINNETKATNESDSANHSPLDAIIASPCMSISDNQEVVEINNELQKTNSERDSANHSPLDVIIASPCMSNISDNQSENSSDSGKGGSEVTTPPPPSRSLPQEIPNAICIFEFVIPQQLVGKLIGKHGSGVANIKEKTGAHVVVRKHPANNKLKVCTIEGSQKEIDSALKLIRDKFPLKRYPDVTLEPVSYFPQVATVPVIPEYRYLKLIEGINNDTVVCNVAGPDHLFLHQPTHPSFPQLNILTGVVNSWYSENETPLVPRPVGEDSLCVAFYGGCWHRARTIATDEESDTTYLRFLDYGGYAWVENSQLRQITVEFSEVPFQAAECYLANIKPIQEGGWTEEAFNAVVEMTHGAIIFTQVIDYAETGVPLVHCYIILGPTEVVFLNKELVNRGHAVWYNSGEEASGVSVA